MACQPVFPKLELAGSLAESGQYGEAEQVLNQAAGLLQEYAGLEAYNPHFARLWKYRALISWFSGDMPRAEECARVSLGYWKKAPGSKVEQEQVKELLKQVGRGFIFPEK